MDIGLTSRTLENIPGHSCSVSIEMRLDQVQALLDQHHAIPGVIVAIKQRPLGILSRAKCYILVHSYAKSGEPLPAIKDLLHDGVIAPTRVFNATDRLDFAVAACLQRHAESVYEPIVITHADQTMRLVEIRELFDAYQQYNMERQQEAQEFMKQSTDRAMRSQNLFVANMSHEIRTPLTAILGFAENILDGNTTREEMQRAAATIVRNGEHLLSLLNDVLDFAKYEAGKLTIEKIPFNLPALLHDVANVMRIKTDAKNLDLQLSQSSPVPEKVISDPTRIRQILINLVGNAVKFTEKGHVEIQVGYQAEENNSGKLVLSVKDTGIGMKRDRMHTLFTPFTQADQSTTRKFGGTGLGLTICRRLTKMLEGEMTVKSVFGQGSEFTTTLAASVPADTKLIYDLAAVETLSGHQAFDYENAQTPCRVFVAEDSPDNQVLITGFLERCGMNVTLGVNGQIAYEKIKEAEKTGQPYDLILMDMQMPILDGFETTARLRKEGIGTPIIALTASVLEQDKQHCLEAGCDTLASKPLDRKRLIEQIRELLPAEFSRTEFSRKKPHATAVQTREAVSSKSNPKFQINSVLADNSKDQRSPFYKSNMGEDDETDDEQPNGFASTFTTGMFPAPKMILVDRKVAMVRSANDPELLATITNLIQEHCPQYMEELASAVANRDAALTKRMAHTIKGSAENVGGERISAVAKQLEISASQALWPQIDAEFEELKGLMTPFLKSVRDLQNSLI